jgi:protein subunit release factor B
MEPHPASFAIPPSDEALLAECDVTTFRASGPGGQHRNKTWSAVRLRHRPSGIVVVGRRRRSQHQNRAEALARLRDRLEALTRERPPRIPTRVPRTASERRLEVKKRRSKIKRLRRAREP